MRIEARGDLEFAPSTNARASRFGELCTTPCVVDLPPGKYKLYLNSASSASNAGDVDVINVHEGMNYYVRAPGKFDPPQWLHVWPSVLATAGLITFTVGAAFAFSHNSGEQTAGIGLMAGGVAVTTAGGILIYDASRGSTQTGATTAWWEPATQR